jgi:hypothetical protein
MQVLHENVYVYIYYYAFKTYSYISHSELGGYMYVQYVFVPASVIAPCRLYTKFSSMQYAYILS